MREINQMERDPLYVVSPSYISPKTKRFGKILVWSSFFLMMDYWNNSNFIQSRKN